jgi:hypothetical protein
VFRNNDIVPGYVEMDQLAPGYIAKKVIIIILLYNNIIGTVGYTYSRKKNQITVK